jgi:hypothetical protein
VCGGARSNVPFREPAPRLVVPLHVAEHCAGNGSAVSALDSPAATGTSCSARRRCGQGRMARRRVEDARAARGPAHFPAFLAAARTSGLFSASGETAAGIAPAFGPARGSAPGAPASAIVAGFKSSLPRRFPRARARAPAPWRSPARHVAPRMHVESARLAGLNQGLDGPAACRRPRSPSRRPSASTWASVARRWSTSVCASVGSPAARAEFCCAGPIPDVGAAGDVLGGKLAVRVTHQVHELLRG